VTDEEFDAFLEQTREELQLKQDALMAKYRLGTFANYWFDQPSGTLEFRDGNGKPHVGATVVPIGSHAPAAGTWMWAWANESIIPDLRTRAEALRQLAGATGIELFDRPMISVSQEMPWELTAIAVHQLRALGAYRAPGERSDLYMAITGVNMLSPA
jgi:hypothetical protein